MENKQTLPNSTGTLVLGILSIIFCSCYGIPGLILGVIAFAISGGSIRQYRENPDLYYGYSNLQAGRVCAIIGMCLSGLYILLIAGMLTMFGTSGMLDMMKKIQESQQQDQYDTQSEDYENWEDSDGSEELEDETYNEEVPEPAQGGGPDTTETL